MNDFRLHTIPKDILDDLGSRFIINVPEEERKDLIRICFQLELAHWFYIDEYVSSDSNAGQLKTCSIREFATHMFKHIRFLRKHADKVEQILDDWRDYKLSVPTYGAIILNENLSKILLVQGYWSKSSWGFPKGKVNEEEPGHVCAIREVLEETGFDIGPYINPNDYLEAVVNDQTICLYLIPGVPTETVFAPKTKCEIRDVQWFPVDALPISKKDGMPDNDLRIGMNNLYMVIPFTRGLRKWIRSHRWQSRSSLTPAGANNNINSERKRNSRKSSASSSDNQRFSESESLSGIPDNFCPKSWSNIKLKELHNVMASTPGWV